MARSAIFNNAALWQLGTQPSHNPWIPPVLYKDVSACHVLVNLEIKEFHSKQIERTSEEDFVVFSTPQFAFALLLGLLDLTRIDRHIQKLNQQRAVSLIRKIMNSRKTPTTGQFCRDSCRTSYLESIHKDQFGRQYIYNVCKSLHASPPTNLGHLLFELKDSPRLQAISSFPTYVVRSSGHSDTPQWILGKNLQSRFYKIQWIRRGLGDSRSST